MTGPSDPFRRYVADPSGLLEAAWRELAGGRLS